MSVTGRSRQFLFGAYPNLFEAGQCRFDPGPGLSFLRPIVPWTQVHKGFTVQYGGLLVVGVSLRQCLAAPMGVAPLAIEPLNLVPFEAVSDYPRHSAIGQLV